MARFPDLLRSLTSAADVLWSAAALRSEPGELACRPGCVGCCTGLFGIGGAEGFLVRAAFEALTPRERDAVRAAAEGICRETASIFPGDISTGVMDSSRTAEVTRYLERTHAIPCPLLGIDGRCRSYASRPLRCRTFGLAIVSGETVERPACPLNFGGAAGGRAVEAGLPLSSLRTIERQLETAVAGAGYDPTVETTIAHAIVGTAFEGNGPGR